MAETFDSIRARRRDDIVARALTEAVNGVPLLRAASGGGIDNPEASLGGSYDTDNNYTDFWRVGDVLESAPLEPSRFS